MNDLEWINERINKWIKQLIKWINKCFNEWMHAWKDE